MTAEEVFGAIRALPPREFKRLAAMLENGTPTAPVAGVLKQRAEFIRLTEQMRGSLDRIEPAVTAQAAELQRHRKRHRPADTERNNRILAELAKGLTPGQVAKILGKEFPDLTRDAVHGVKRRSEQKRHSASVSEQKRPLP